MAEFRFECKFCNNAIHVGYELGGKKIRCPHCKNPVSVPVKKVVGEKKAQVQNGKQVVKRKDPNRRPIAVRHGFSIKSLIKWLVIIAVLFVGYKFYKEYEKKYQQDLSTLLSNYNGGVADASLIYTKVKDEDFSVLKEFSNSSDSETRALVAKCFGKLVTTRMAPILEKLLKDKEDYEVRLAAATSFRSLPYRNTIVLLIDRLDIERNDEVRAEIGQTLRAITGVTQSVKRRDLTWRKWWKEEGHLKWRK